VNAVSERLRNAYEATLMQAADVVKSAYIALINLRDDDELAENAV
jgi:isocitrate dehydrogenase kinase/phosphatase